MKAVNKKILLPSLLLAIVCVIIFWFSAQNGVSSSSQSSGPAQKIIYAFFPDFDSYGYEARSVITDLFVILVRKGAHFAVYALVGALSFAAFSKIKKTGIRYLCAVGFTFLYACTDEIHQAFVPGRAGRFSDVILDTCGGVVGAFIVMISIILIFGAKLLQKEKADESV